MGSDIKLNLRSSSSGDSDDDLQEMLYGSIESNGPSAPVSTQPTQNTPSAAPVVTLHGSGDALRGRVKKSAKPDIDDVWDDLRKRQVQDGADSEHLLANREIGEVIDRVGAVVGGASKRFKKAYSQASTTTKKSQPKTTPKFRTPTSTEGISSRPTSHSLRARMRRDDEHTRSRYDLGGLLARPKAFVQKRRKLAVGLTLGAAVLLLGAAFTGVGGDTATPETAPEQTLGASSTPAEVSTTPLPSEGGPEIVSTTEFELLYPNSKTIDDFEVAEVSPPNNEAVYAYVDTFQGIELRLSQQAIPLSFIGEEGARLAEVATEFQATDILQIDELTVYYGFTDRFGGVQSLVFIKNDVMVFILVRKSFLTTHGLGIFLVYSKITDKIRRLSC